MTDYTVYEFEGQNFRVLQTKNIEDKWMLKTANKLRTIRPQKEIILEKFRFYPVELPNLLEREAYAYKRLIDYVPTLDTTIESKLAMRLFNAEREKIRNAVPLSRHEEEEKNRMLKMGFQNWSKGEYSLLSKSMRLFGRSDYTKLANYIQTKTADEVKEYLSVFWQRVHEISNANQLIQSIENTEEILRKKKELNEILDKIMKPVKNPFKDIHINYSLGQRNDSNNLFSKEEDKILVWLYYKYKSFYLNDETTDGKHENEIQLFKRIRDEIRCLPNFRLNWYFLSCDANMLNKRCKYLLGLIQKEHGSITTFKSSTYQPFKFSEIDLMSDQDESEAKFNRNNDADNTALSNQMSDCLIDEDEDNDNTITLDYLESSDSDSSSDSSVQLISKNNKKSQMNLKQNQPQTSQYSAKQLASASVSKNVQNTNKSHKHEHRVHMSVPKVKYPEPRVCYIDIDDDDALPTI